ncbi:MAG: DUF1707 domain-containing protein [Pseudonocardia sp.]|nr:DUF1707 domain-containing protein [Pseudonocardia sp.]
MTGDIERAELRASDADRDAVATRLQTAVDEGRLSLSDYDERLRDAYASRTYRDLDRVTSDLPGPVPVATPLTKEKATKEKAACSGQPDEWRSWGGVAIVLISIWGVTSLLSWELHAFWPAFPLGIWAAILIATMLTGRKHGTH